MEKKEKISLITIIILFGFVIGVYLNRLLPNNQLLLDSEFMFFDFLSLTKKAFYLCNYLPFSTLIITLFSFIKPVYVSLFVFFAIFLGFFIRTANKHISTADKFNDWKNVLILTFLSFPMFFLFDRGNFETFVYIFIYMFVFLFFKKRYGLASFFLSLAISMKIYPIVFVLLFFSKSKTKLKWLFVTGILTLLISIFSLIIIPGHIMEILKEIHLQMSGYSKMYVVDNAGLDFNNSLYGFIKVPIQWFSYYFPGIIDINIFQIIYFVIAVFLFCFLGWYLIYIEKRKWSKIFLIVASMCLLPFVSPAYRLIHFFISMFLFVNYKFQSKYDLLYSILFGLLMIPKNIPIKQYPYASTFFDPIILMIFVSFVIYEGFLMKNQKLKTNDLERAE